MIHLHLLRLRLGWRPGNSLFVYIQFYILQTYVQHEKGRSLGGGVPYIYITLKGAPRILTGHFSRRAVIFL